MSGHTHMSIGAVGIPSSIINGKDPAPYLALWAGVMSQALTDVRTYLKAPKLRGLPLPRGAGAADARNALAWITDGSARPGGFLWCCDLFDLNPDYVRAEAAKPRPTGAVKKLSEGYDENL